MPFKINVSQNGKTLKVETENEDLLGKYIGETIEGSLLSDALKGYELQITGTSDLSGIPGFKGLEGAEYHRKVLSYGPGMKDRRKGMRLRKTMRGEEISLKTHQINTIVVKEGSTTFADILAPKEEAPAAEVADEKPAEPIKKEKPAEAKEEKPKEEKPAKPTEKPKEEKKE